MKVVVLLSKTFFPQHPKAGKVTCFEQKVMDGRKKHTCRKNYQYWRDKINKLQESGGVLSVRQWIGQPFKQPGQGTIVDIPADTVGIQKLELTRKNGEWSAIVEGYNTPVSLLAVNDGLTEQELKDWFAPVFEKEKAEVLTFAIIHFTKERY
ncbi:MAG: hypothetical protein LIP01_02990 [Tannerellaceae bacterium]|nr:hypothetical protein [Tannerellaceae bacterium]